MSQNYAILPKFCDKPDIKNEKAKELIKEICKIRTDLKKSHGTKWKQARAKAIPYKLNPNSIKD